MPQHYDTDAKVHVELAENTVKEREAKITQMKQYREELFQRLAKTNEDNVQLRLTIEALYLLLYSICLFIYICS